jgi:hypothetical protein
MADERFGASTDGTARPGYLWTELFKTFQVALDPKKLALAAAGILVMFLGWWFLSWAFYSARSEPKQIDYSPEVYTKRGLTPDEANRRSVSDFEAAKARYYFLQALAAPADEARPVGILRTLNSFRTAPWNENRGPNPYLLITGQEGRVWVQGHFFDWLLFEQVPVLIEPLVKILRPVVLLFNPNADGWNRLYLLLITFWTLLTWALFGGAITRIAAVQLAGKDRAGLRDALRFVLSRYGAYLAAPLVPLVFIALITLLSILYGVIHLIPLAGDVVDSVAWLFVILLGFGQAILLVGLVGYPLMYATVSTEGSDTFDALSRSYSYVFQSPWHYIWYGLVALAYGIVVVFFVTFMGSLVVYLSKWSVSQTPGTEYFSSRRVDNLFAYAPVSFGWRDLLVDVPELLDDRVPPVVPNEEPKLSPRAQYMRDHFYWWNYVSSFMVSLWITLIFLLVIGFSYSYFYTASTVIYLLMRRKVDDTDLDEVYLEEEEADEPLLPPSEPAAAPAGPAVTMVEAPTLRTPAAEVPAPAAATATPPPPEPPSGNGPT